MFTHIFKVKKNEKATAVTFKVEMPSSLEDMDLIVKRFGSAERMVAQACRQWTVSAAVGIRKRLPDIPKATAYAVAYCDDGSKDVVVKVIRPTMTRSQADALGFTPEQLAAVNAVVTEDPDFTVGDDEDEDEQYLG